MHLKLQVDCETLHHVPQRKHLGMDVGIFSWFVNAQGFVKGCLPKYFFKLKAKNICTEWVVPKSQLTRKAI